MNFQFQSLGRDRLSLVVGQHHEIERDLVEPCFHFHRISLGNDEVVRIGVVGDPLQLSGPAIFIR